MEAVNSEISENDIHSENDRGTDIIITIPYVLSHEFLGIFALDVLHDAKGRGYLAGNRLVQLTDLMAHFTGAENSEVKCQIFKSVLFYFMDLWRANLSALGITEITGLPDFSRTELEYWQQWQSAISLPLYMINSADRCADTFCPLREDQYSIEAQNYLNQREKLMGHDNVELLSFISPGNLDQTFDYFRQAQGIVDIISNRLSRAKVVLDMKSSAGLIRTLTDPIGYITGLPTYADPGYNMPGMSAIRKHAQIDFVVSEQQCYNTAKNFRYQVRIDLGFQTITFLDVNYFYGVGYEGLDRSNLMMISKIASVNNELYHNSLPRSGMMAEALKKYFRTEEQYTKIAVRDILHSLQDHICELYNTDCTSHFDQQLNTVYSQLQQGQIILDSFTNLLSILPDPENSAAVVDWIKGTQSHGTIMDEAAIIRCAIILATIKNVENYNLTSIIQLSVRDLLPNQMIKDILPQAMKMADKHLNLLAFSYHQLNLLKEYGAKNPEIQKLLNNQWIEKKIGKLCTKIPAEVKTWRANQQTIVEFHRPAMIHYINLLIKITLNNLPLLDDPEILLKLPPFNPGQDLQTVLLNHLYFYQPKAYKNSMAQSHMALAFNALLDMLIWSKPHTDLGIDVNEEFTVTTDDSELISMAMKQIIGKFSGDFGQIIWCMHMGQIFATEDNNASAMATMLHRLPAGSILSTNGPRNWANIHGLGDGSSVEVNVSAPFPSSLRERSSAKLTRAQRELHKGPLG